MPYQYGADAHQGNAHQVGELSLPPDELLEHAHCAGARARQASSILPGFARSGEAGGAGPMFCLVQAWAPRRAVPAPRWSLPMARTKNTPQRRKALHSTAATPADPRPSLERLSEIRRELRNAH